MTFNNLPAVVLGLVAILSFGGCCSSGSCGSCAASNQQVYPAPTPAPTPAPVSDCGCGCSAAPDSAMSYESSDLVVIGDSYGQGVASSDAVSYESPYVVGETTLPASVPTPVVEAPAINGTPGFTAGSATKAANALPGNLLPGN